MRYLCLLYGEAGAGPAPGTADHAEMLAEFASATDAMERAGVLVDSSPLQPAQAGRTCGFATARRC
jgi:hypothetical protein